MQNCARSRVEEIMRALGAYLCASTDIDETDLAHQAVLLEHALFGQDGHVRSAHSSLLKSAR